MKNTVLICSSSLIVLLWTAFAQANLGISEKTARELLPVVCKAGQSVFIGSQGQKSVGSCNPCPSFTSWKGEKEPFDVQSVIFAKPNKKNETLAIMDFFGCEPHVNNFGGTVILRWLGNTNWQFVQFNAGQRTNECLKFATQEGTDKLVCKSFYGGQGITSEGLAVESFDQNIDGQSLVGTISNSGQCMNEKLVDFAWQVFKQKDLNNDKRPDLYLEISERNATIAKDKLCANGAATDIPWGKSKLHKLEFIFEGGQFKPTKATITIVKYLEKFGS